MRPRSQKSVRIQDSIHGIVELSPLETYVVDSLPFQRLLNVKQLGMAYAVFPGADYSRFSHCVGVCHQMGRWLESLGKFGPKIDEPKKRLYRLAALLHDIGHYPFSHTLEHAVADHYKDEARKLGSLETLSMNHELIGSTIVADDNELEKALIEIGLNRQTLQNIFANEDITKISPLLSSDLDADRIDYLRRTAHHTGLPYGLVDVQYLTTEIRIDDLERPCWTERALHALDHLLAARFYDYQQIVFNKTVAGLELALSRVVRRMLEVGQLKLSSADIKKKLSTEEWIDWDDHALFQEIKAFRDDCTDAEYKSLSNSLLKRNPPRVVFQHQYIGPSSDRKRFKAWENAIEQSLKRWAAHFNMNDRLWFNWSKSFSWTEYKLDEPVGLEQAEMPELAKLPRVLQDGKKRSIPLVCHPSSVTRTTYLQRAYMLRVYVLLESDTDFERRKEICEYVSVEATALMQGILEQSEQTTMFETLLA